MLVCRCFAFWAWPCENICEMIIADCGTLDCSKKYPHFCAPTSCAALQSTATKKVTADQHRCPRVVGGYWRRETAGQGGFVCCWWVAVVSCNWCFLLATSLFTMFSSYDPTKRTDLLQNRESGWVLMQCCKIHGFIVGDITKLGARCLIHLLSLIRGYFKKNLSLFFWPWHFRPRFFRSGHISLDAELCKRRRGVQHLPDTCHSNEKTGFVTPVFFQHQ